MNIYKYISIAKRIGIASILLMASGIDFVYASKGEGDDKSKKGVVLVVNGFELKKTYMTPKTLMGLGATYKGTIMGQQPTNTTKHAPNPHSSMVTFERGNTIYIVPLHTPKIIQKFKVPSRNNFKY